MPLKYNISNYVEPYRYWIQIMFQLALCRVVPCCWHPLVTQPPRSLFKHCQRHNGPEGWVLLTKETSSYTNLDQIPKFKIFRPNFNIKILTKHSLHNLTKPQQQNTDQTSVSKVSLELQLQTLGQTLCSKSEQNLALWPNFSFQNCIKLSSNVSHHQHQQSDN